MKRSNLQVITYALSKGYKVFGQFGDDLNQIIFNADSGSDTLQFVLPGVFIRSVREGWMVSEWVDKNQNYVEYDLVYGNPLEALDFGHELYTKRVEEGKDSGAQIPSPEQTAQALAPV